MTQIAIIGAGLAGLSLARALPEQAEITLFEKSRGIGGRMATRYAGAYEFDHGAQYFTARSPLFSDLLSEYQTSGQVRLWPEPVATLSGARETSTEKYVASPRMNTLCKTLAEGFDIRTHIEIERLETQGNSWHLHAQDGTRYGPFDWVISAAPAPQASTLLAACFSGHEVLQSVKMAGCFSLMLGFETAINVPWPAARIESSPVGWIALNSAKPGRNTACSLLIQSSNAWAETHLETPQDEVAALLLAEASRLTRIDLTQAAHRALHRWRYAATPVPAGRGFLIDTENQLAACGDWCLGSKVEAAFTSGQSLGAHLANLI